MQIVTPLIICYNASMKIEWNKVTWYSKLAAVVLFVLVLWLGISFGEQYQKALNDQQLAHRATSAVSDICKLDLVPTGQVSTIPDTSGWQTYKNEQLGFSVQYPADFKLIEDLAQFPPGITSDAVVIGKARTDGSFESYVAFRKVHSSLKAEIAKGFDWNLESLRPVYLNNQWAWVLDYNNASLDQFRSYLFPAEGPAGPGDAGDKVTDMIATTTDTVVTSDSGRAHTVADDIVATLKLLSK